MSPIEVRRTVEQLINDYRLKAGLGIETFKRKRGRPLKHPHPLPRREKKSWELLDSSEHRLKHQAVYVESCTYCYTREHAYFTRHPEKLKPDFGKHSSPRPWLDHGWAEHKAKSEAQKKEAQERRRFIRTKGRS